MYLFAALFIFSQPVLSFAEEQEHQVQERLEIFQKAPQLTEHSTPAVSGEICAHLEQANKDMAAGATTATE